MIFVATCGIFCFSFSKSHFIQINSFLSQPRRISLDSIIYKRKMKHIPIRSETPLLRDVFCAVISAPKCDIRLYYTIINISFIWLAKIMRCFLDRTLWTLSKPSIFEKINLYRTVILTSRDSKIKSSVLPIFCLNLVITKIYKKNTHVVFNVNLLNMTQRTSITVYIIK